MLKAKNLNIISFLIFFLGLSMLPSSLWSLSSASFFNYSDRNFFDFMAIIKSSSITCVSGILLYLITRFLGKNKKNDLKEKDGFIIVTIGWLLCVLFSSLPYYFSSTPLSFTNSFFESMSGLTTTGATVLGDSSTFQIEELSIGILFWRSFTQFIGGMGIIVFSIAILPILGIGGVQLFRAEVAGPVAEKITPRVKQTAKLLWGIYVGLVLFQTLILKFEGMTLFDSLCHSFTTIATAGFSTKNASIAAFNSTTIELTIIIFMIIAATNFSLHYLFLAKGKFDYFKDEEFKIYFYIIIFISLTLFLDINLNGSYNWSLNSMKDAIFTTTSLVTTTGFSTADFESFPSLSKMCIFFLFFLGGTAGSTTGAIKIIRTMLIFKYLSYELKKLIHPQGVYSIKIGKSVVSDEVLKNTLGFYLFYIFIFVGTAIIFSFFEFDMITSLSIAASSIGNIGPGLGDIGPTDSWGHLPPLAKWMSTFCMLLGRLEIFTVMILFSKTFWRA
ncbi:MAG: potassium transporter [Candidatus Marinimicrobia bacterium]|nr:potassium transporter [Candidatus Neomarinimicrobiota bacterium]|tara:strand:+ start:29738 stop:31240 length:1503 start_codon:yes stop_codon:yes gene_type:complete